MRITPEQLEIAADSAVRGLAGCGVQMIVRDLRTERWTVLCPAARRAEVVMAILMVTRHHTRVTVVLDTVKQQECITFDFNPLAD